MIKICKKIFFILVLCFGFMSCQKNQTNKNYSDSAYSTNQNSSSSSSNSIATSSSTLKSTFNIPCKTVAHRGYHVTAVENTKDAFIAAGKKSFWGIETDIHKTKDGVWICHHDPAIQSGEEKYIITELTYEETQKLPLDNTKNVTNAYVPKFSEYVAICKQYKKNAYIELKTTVSDSDLTEIVNYLIEQDMASHSNIISFDFNNMLKVKALEDKNNYGLYYEWLTGSSTGYQQAITKKIPISIEYSKLTQPIFNQFKDAGLSVAIWTLDNNRTSKSYIDMGVRSITSNLLDCALEFNSNW